MSDLKYVFESAKIKHFVFKSKVKSYLYGSNTPLEPILNYRQCSFGQWIYDVGLPRFDHLPEMHQLEKVHRDIHDHAIYLVNLKQADRTETALAGLPKLEQLADSIVELLKQIQDKAEID
ncbi:hypothetical protein AAE02nite_16990 [Adhaeribacter aerolatus]|uniref:Chemoreceptor zinc-binding domain-containing protein n=1 Tax=Adhaeribacter aerolatus TaxID=670289 RepID=A0A512AWE8_9BACT|nr:CZB domain-containing protein [Adhaeribacter aerolatus]GEO04035.1 hypothetical protein AAE02nite_16990 [Adhaeribacter aerolatus]